MSLCVIRHDYDTILRINRDYRYDFDLFSKGIREKFHFKNDINAEVVTVLLFYYFRQLAYLQVVTETCRNAESRRETEGQRNLQVTYRNQPQVLSEVLQ